MADSVLEAIKSYFAALNSGDLDGVAAAFDDAASVMPPDAATATGIEAVRSLYATRLATLAYERELHVDELISYDALAVVRCHTTGALTTRSDGRRTEATSREVFVVGLTDGRWRIRWYMFNRPGPTEGQA